MSTYNECDEGWSNLIDPLIKLCDEHNVTIVQIKEKFGGLRFYVNAAPLVVHDAIFAAEQRSFYVCEKCGLPGTRRGGSWIKTLCNVHHKEREDNE